MTRDESQPVRWASARWLFCIVAVCLGQAGLLFWVGDAPPAAPRASIAAPNLALSGPATNQLLALNDPTLFALPHRQGFSGEGWLASPRQEFVPYEWTEPLEWLKVPVAQLGSAFEQMMATNRFRLEEVALQAPPPLTMPRATDAEFLPVRSTLSIEGPLAQRRLLSTLNLPSWRSAELLTNSVVETVVDALGNAVSVTLLRPSSGSTNADQFALEQARAVRFAPLPTAAGASPFAGLTGGELVFQWHTEPLANNTRPAK